MDFEPHERIKPVCRFGPGGDFVFFWPPLSAHSRQRSSGRLRTVLSLLGEVVTVLFGSEFDTAVAGEVDTEQEAQGFCREEHFDNAFDGSKSDGPAYPPTVTIVRSNRRFWSQPMLFADDWRAGDGIRHKPKHRIRTYQRTAKKGPALGPQTQKRAFGNPLHPAGQGSLFEADFKGAKTA